MKRKYGFVCLLLVVLALLGYGFCNLYAGNQKQTEDENINIVTSFYPMYVTTLNIVGDAENVAVTNLSEPQTGCLHDYQLTPQDMILLSGADIFVVNGGGIETFLTDVAKQYPNLVIIEAGEGLQDSRTEGEIHDHAHEEEHQHEHGENAHYWMSIAHYMTQVGTIAEGMAAADAEHAKEYRQNAAAYLDEIEILRQEVQGLSSKMEHSDVVIFHEAFEFLAEDWGLHVATCLNLDEERQVSAGEVADILKLMEEHEIEVLLAEELYGSGICETIRKETNCRVYYLDPLVRGQWEKDGWIRGMQENIRLLKEAFDIEDE